MSHFQFADYFYFQFFRIFWLVLSLFFFYVCTDLCELVDLRMVIQVELNKIVEIMRSLNSTPFEVNETLVCLNTTGCSHKLNRVL